MYKEVNVTDYKLYIAMVKYSYNYCMHGEAFAGMTFFTSLRKMYSDNNLLGIPRDNNFG